MFGHHILKMYLRHRLTKICILRRISLVTSHVSRPYKSTGFTSKIPTWKLFNCCSSIKRPTSDFKISVLNFVPCPYCPFVTTVSQLRICDFSGETFKVLLRDMSSTTTQLLSSGEFCKLRYDAILVKSASADVSFYTSN